MTWWVEIKEKVYKNNYFLIFSTNGMVSAFYQDLSSICYVGAGGFTGTTNMELRTNLFQGQVSQRI